MTVVRVNRAEKMIESRCWFGLVDGMDTVQLPVGYSTAGWKANDKKKKPACGAARQNQFIRIRKRRLRSSSVE
jgi:hypothetical protein